MGYPSLQPQPIMGPIAAAAPQLIMAPNGSIRSVHSVPVLAAAAAAAAHHHHQPHAPTWDGEPCPVHHHMPLAALYSMNHQPPPPPALSLAAGPASVPPSVISGATTVRRARSVAEISNHGGYLMPPPGTPHLEAKSFHGSLHAMHMASAPHTPAMVRSATLPAGHHRVVLTENGAPSHLPMRDPKNRSPLPRKDDGKDLGIGCCSGHFVVIWIILGIITFGILLAIILRFTIEA